MRFRRFKGLFGMGRREDQPSQQQMAVAATEAQADGSSVQE